MKDRLYLNEVLIDLEESERPSLTEQVNDLAELKDRQASYTSTFRIRVTQNVKRALENCQWIQSATNLPYTKVPARYIHSGIEVVPDGYAVIEKASKDFITVQILYGTASFFEKIKNKTLQDLDLSAWNHLYDVPTIASLMNSFSEVVYPPVVCTQEPTDVAYSGTDKINAKRMLPFVYCRDVVNKIVEEAGFTHDGTGYFSTGKLYDYFIMSIGNDTFKKSGKLLVAKPDPSGFRVFYDIIGSRVLEFADYNTGSPITQVGTFNSMGYTGNNDIVIPADVQSPSGIKVKMKIDYQVNSLGNFQTLFSLDILALSGPPITVQPNGQVTGATIRRRDTATIRAIPNQSFTGSITVTLGACSLVAGDIISFWGGASNGGAELIVLNSSVLEVVSDTGFDIAIGDPVDVAKQMPKISQLDFVKAFAQIGAVTLDVDNDTKELFSVPFTDIVSNKANAEDWTLLVDEEADHEVDYHPRGYAQKNFMRYKRDQTVSSGYGDGDFALQDETLDAERDLFTLPFAATENVQAFSALDVPFIKRWDANGKSVKVEPRLLLIDFTGSQNAPSTITVDDGVTTVTPASYRFAYFIDNTIQESLSFSYLIQTFYTELIDALQQSKQMSIPLRLKSNKIESFNPFIPKYFQQYNSFFYVSKIDSWKEGETCKAIGLKI